MSRVSLHRVQKCHARNRQGQQCGNWAIPGGAVCRMHGGASPKVQAAARERLAALVHPAIERLTALLHQDEDRKVALGAVKLTLDTNDITGKTVVEHGGELTITRVVREIVDPAKMDGDA